MICRFCGIFSHSIERIYYHLVSRIYRSCFSDLFIVLLDLSEPTVPALVQVFSSVAVTRLAFAARVSGHSTPVTANYGLMSIVARARCTRDCRECVGWVPSLMMTPSANVMLPGALRAS